MKNKFYQKLENNIAELKQQGLYKHEHLITSDQSTQVKVDGREIINLCAAFPIYDN